MLSQFSKYGSMLVNIVNCVQVKQYCSQTLVLFNLLFFVQGHPVPSDTSHASCRSTGWHLATIRISCFHTPSGTRSLKIPSILFTLVCPFHGLQIVVWFKQTVTVAREKVLQKSIMCFFLLLKWEHSYLLQVRG